VANFTSEKKLIEQKRRKPHKRYEASILFGIKMVRQTCVDYGRSFAAKENPQEAPVQGARRRDAPPLGP
jgi:hypothetical protein